MACSKLIEIAQQARPEMLARNRYSELNRYSSAHPDATQQTTASDPNNTRGRGTGVMFDTQNGGNFYDINGRPEVYGSGRNAIYYVNTYNPDNRYDCVI